MISYSGLIKLGFSPEEFKLQDDSLGEGVYIKEWNSAKPQPSEERIHIASLEAQAEFEAKEYSRQRAEAYASINEQMDMQYHDAVEGSRTWLDHIEAVKEAYPK